MYVIMVNQTINQFIHPSIYLSISSISSIYPSIHQSIRLSINPSNNIMRFEVIPSSISHELSQGSSVKRVKATINQVPSLYE